MSSSDFKRAYTYLNKPLLQECGVSDMSFEESLRKSFGDFEKENGNLDMKKIKDQVDKISKSIKERDVKMLIIYK